MIRFDLWPLFQGQMRIAKIKSVYNSLIHVPRGLQCHANLLEIMGYFDVVRFCIGSPMRYVKLRLYLSLSKHFVYLVSIQIAPINT